MKEKNEVKQSKYISEKILLIIAFIFILGGSAIFLYPEVSNHLAEKNHTEAIREYDTLVIELDEEAINSEFQKAQTYNENLSGDPVHDPFIIGSGYALPDNYTEVLNVTGDGIMGYVEIPKISVYLPIYHGTSEEVLVKGVGHIESTSLPIGGNSTHSVLTGHTGLPSAELFTRLDELEIGDIFYIHVLGKILTYKMYQTKVILPQDIDELQITNGKDLVTLVTCTPYGVNTHRLLVKAEKVEYEPYIDENFNNNEEGKGESVTQEKNYYLVGAILGFILFIVIIIIIFVIKFISRRRKNQ